MRAVSKLITERGQLVVQRHVWSQGLVEGMFLIAETSLDGQRSVIVDTIRLRSESAGLKAGPIVVEIRVTPVSSCPIGATTMLVIWQPLDRLHTWHGHRFRPLSSYDPSWLESRVLRQSRGSLLLNAGAAVSSRYSPRRTKLCPDFTRSSPLHPPLPFLPSPRPLFYSFLFFTVDHAAHTFLRPPVTCLSFSISLFFFFPFLRTTVFFHSTIQPVDSLTDQQCSSVSKDRPVIGLLLKRSAAMQHIDGFQQVSRLRARLVLIEQRSGLINEPSYRCFGKTT